MAKRASKKKPQNVAGLDVAKLPSAPSETPKEMLDIKDQAQTLKKIRIARDKTHKATAFDIVSALNVGDTVQYHQHREYDKGGILAGTGKVLGFKTRNLLSVIILSDKKELVEVHLGPSSYKNGGQAVLEFINKKASVFYSNGREKAFIQM